MRKYSVLIIDDHQEWCDALKDEIKQYVMFDVAPPLYNGKDAIAYISAHKPDVILLDLVMPVMDGFYVINHVRSEMPGYRPFIYVLSAIGTEKTNKIMRNLDVDYYSVKPINTKAVAFNLHKLVIDGDGSNYLFTGQSPLLGLDNQIEDFLYELGAPLYLLSTKCTRTALHLCLVDESRLNNVSSLYALVAEQYAPSATPASIERNIRSTVRNMQKKPNEYFSQCFPYGHKRLTNAEFINSTVYLLKQRIEEYFGDQVFIRKNGGLHCPE